LRGYELEEIDTEYFTCANYELYAENKNAIIKMLDSSECLSSKPNKRVLIKYLWLASYHNYYLKQLIEKTEDYSGEEYLINIEEVFCLEWKQYADTHPDFQFVEFEVFLKS
jgi:hypothetical protein